MWMQRGAEEARLAPRTWWCTFTYASREGEHGRYSPLPSYEHVKRLLRGVSRIDPRVRYVVTYEKGSIRGRPHWHALLHVTHDVKKRDIEALWPHGFTKVNLSQGPGHAAYMTKYAAKEGRIRASVGYGRLFWPDHILEKEPSEGFRTYAHNEWIPAILRARRASVAPAPIDWETPPEPSLRKVQQLLIRHMDGPRFEARKRTFQRLLKRYETRTGRKSFDVVKYASTHTSGNDLRKTQSPTTINVNNPFDIPF